MSVQRWVLTATDEPFAESLHIVPGDIPGTPPDWFAKKRRLQAGLSQGVDLVEISAGRLRVAIVPTRGMGLWRAWIDDYPLGWQSPVRGPVHPSFVNVAEPGGMGWLDGFDELMCRCGLESFGSPEHDQQGRLRFPLHGRIANRPAHRVELAVDDVAGTMTLRGAVEECRYHFQKLRLTTEYVLRFDATELIIRDVVENYGGGPARMQMLYHVNLGLPLLGAGSQLRAPVQHLRPGSASSAGDAATNWATYDGPTPGYVQQVYYYSLLGNDAGDTLVLLKDAAGARAAKMEFNINRLPCFTQWKNSVAEADGYVTGIEPGTSFPEPSSAEEAAGRVVTLQSGGAWRAELSLDLLATAASIDQAEARIAELQGTHEPVVQLDWP